ncbi:MAG TPA: hypothetical protein VKC64_05510 [Burkholderiales bacterium]|nr:hypothetical protein [Burkholderiales bacterium]
MSKMLPKGHLSCLSKTFRYTPAAHTNVAQTFARIARELKEREEQSAAVQADPQHAMLVSRPFPLETVQSAWRRLRTAGLRAALHPELVIVR